METKSSKDAPRMTEALVETHLPRTTNTNTTMDGLRTTTTTTVITTTTITTTRSVTSRDDVIPLETTDDSEQSSSLELSYVAAAAAASASASSHSDGGNVVTAGHTTSNTTSSGDDHCTYNPMHKPAIPSDGYGLPMPRDDHLQRKAHAAVIARLPPPDSTLSTFMSSSSEKGTSSSWSDVPKLPCKPKSSRMFDSGSASDQSGNHGYPRKRKKLDKRPKTAEPNEKKGMQDNSSGSGTEGGYAGEESSSAKPSSCSSPSLSSGEDHGNKRKRQENGNAASDSSSIVDFESSESSSPDTSSDEDLPFNLVGLKMQVATRRKLQGSSMLQSNYESAMYGKYGKPPSVVEKKRLPTPRTGLKSEIPPPRHMTNVSGLASPNGKPPIFSLSNDVMAHCMTFLEPLEVHELLTMPLCKDWRVTYTIPQELWRVLCLMEPFKAKVDIESHESDEGSYSMLSEGKHLLGSYRLLYTSFVLCLRYLARIKDDAMNGRPPSVQGYGIGEISPLRANVNLKSFLARARGIIVKNKKTLSDCDTSSSGGLEDPVGVTDENSSVESIPAAAAKQKKTKKTKGVTYGHSQLTQRLLGPSKNGDAGNVNLPWSCAIYSIVNWMVAFSDVEGIQTMCLKVLPYLLEDESQRTTAQRAGLTDVVLRGMVLFPDSVQLHTAAFHTIVLLARPLGGREGMLFHCSMVNSSGIFNDGSKTGKNGIAIMLDSMRRFEDDDVLQAMSCWSLVNIALAPSQKAVLVKLGGISVVANAMLQHPYNAEVQFRALFALINLVIPAVNLADGDNNNINAFVSEALGEADNMTEKEMLDESVAQIANLVVAAMKNFCASESILNRACLVLHNLSLTEDYHTTLLWTPNGYQMLEWCLANYRTDQVLQQSAAGTLHRLQTTLSNNDDLRQRFTASLQSQQQKSSEQAHQEARLLHLQEQLVSNSQQPQPQP